MKTNQRAIQFEAYEREIKGGYDPKAWREGVERERFSCYTKPDTEVPPHLHLAFNKAGTMKEMLVDVGRFMMNDESKDALTLFVKAMLLAKHDVKALVFANEGWMFDTNRIRKPGESGAAAAERVRTMQTLLQAQGKSFEEHPASVETLNLTYETKARMVFAVYEIKRHKTLPPAFVLQHSSASDEDGWNYGGRFSNWLYQHPERMSHGS